MKQVSQKYIAPFYPIDTIPNLTVYYNQPQNEGKGNDYFDKKAAGACGNNHHDKEGMARMKTRLF